MTREKQIEDNFIKRLCDLKYSYRPDICNRETLEQNFRVKFEQLNRVHLTDAEFDRLLDEITDSDVYASSKRLRERNTLSEKTEHLCNILWLISKNGAKTSMKSLINFV
jgi:type I restriction enzyme R subunit